MPRTPPQARVFIPALCGWTTGQNAPANLRASDLSDLWSFIKLQQVGFFKRLSFRETHLFCLNAEAVRDFLISEITSFPYLWSCRQAIALFLNSANVSCVELNVTHRPGLVLVHASITQTVYYAATRASFNFHFCFQAHSIRCLLHLQPPILFSLLLVLLWVTFKHFFLFVH